MVQEIIGTFTPTPTATITPSPTTTATMTPSPTITPPPTPEPFDGFLLVNNQTGERIKTAEFLPDCGGEWGMPGVDIWRVEDDVPVLKICSTPWNRPQNTAIKAVGVILLLIAMFVAALFIWNVVEETQRKKRRLQQNATHTKIGQLAGGPPKQVQEGISFKSFLQAVNAVDSVLANKVLEFKTTHRDKCHGLKVEEFLALLVQLNPPLFFDVQNALNRAKEKAQ